MTRITPLDYESPFAHLENTPLDDFEASHSLVVVANRLPVVRSEDGSWSTSPGGLVSAVYPVLGERGGAWVGWSGVTGEDFDAFELDGLRMEPIALDAEERDFYYLGFSNRTLWPLYHDAVRAPEFHRRWMRQYLRINRRFARRAASIVAPGGTVWVHDYHLHLVPAILRALRPDVRIGFFLHIPFPPQDLFAQLPWRTELLKGTLGADVIGMQVPRDAEKFVLTAERFTDARWVDGALQYEGRRVQVGAFPISIDVAAIGSIASSEETELRVAEHRARIGANTKVLMGIDRLDYTKGIDVRLRAFQELLRAGVLDPESCVFIQSVVPTRARIDEYADLRSSVEELVGQINGEFGQVGRPVVHYLRRNHDVQELVSLYRLADVMMVTPFQDGMNLVAKEYVASRINNDGVLVLSEFSGAAQELTDALIVNPHDLDGLQQAVARAVSMSDDEMEDRMTAMRKLLESHDVNRWANAFLHALETGQ